MNCNYSLGDPTQLLILTIMYFLAKMSTKGSRKLYTWDSMFGIY